jgi:hypothetical protein
MLEYPGLVDMVKKEDILTDYSICQFLDRDTWKIRFRVVKQPIEDNPYFEHPVFDTWEEATHCVAALRCSPMNYMQTVDGDWVAVENI